MNINLTPAVKQIAIACAVLFIGTWILKQRDIDLIAILGLHYPKSDSFKPWQILTHMFMHGDIRSLNVSITHILFNMFALISFGVVLEQFLGTKKFVQLYFISGFGAMIVHIAVQLIQLHYDYGMWMPSFSDLGIKIEGDQIFSNGTFVKTQAELAKVGGILGGTVVGASGAIYGVSVAFAYLFPNSKLMIMFIPYPIAAKILIPIVVLLDVFLGFSNFQNDPIAHFAHIGGALFGFLVVWYWRKFDKKNFY
jgi:membrane associated rhomboid family serine protease